MSSVRMAPEGVSKDGITVRPPRLRVATQQSAGPPDVGRALRTSAPLGSPVVAVYRVSTGTHQQTGVVLETSLADYRSGRIRRHEATDPEREDRLVSYAETVGVEHTPVMLTHRPRAGLRATLAEVASHPSYVDFQVDGQVHSVWVAYDVEVVRAVLDELGSLTTLYIADGHHRMAAAERAARNGRDGFALGALFPSDEMRVFGYPRSVPRPRNLSTAEVITMLGTAPGATAIEDVGPVGDNTALDPTRPGTVAVFVDGRQYRLRLGTPRDDPRSALDVVALDETVIAALFAGIDPQAPDAFEATELAEWCLRHDAIGFLPHPPSMAQIRAVSDAGKVLPPKSTWFAPKATAGLFLRELE